MEKGTRCIFAWSYLLIKYFVKEMCLNKSGSVINIGSDLSVIAPNQKIYKKT